MVHRVTLFLRQRPWLIEQIPAEGVRVPPKPNFMIVGKKLLYNHIFILVPVGVEMETRAKEQHASNFMEHARTPKRKCNKSNSKHTFPNNAQIHKYYLPSIPHVSPCHTSTPQPVSSTAPDHVPRPIWQPHKLMDTQWLSRPKHYFSTTFASEWLMGIVGKMWGKNEVKG